MPYNDMEDTVKEIRYNLESVQLRRHCNSKATPTSRQSIGHIINIFCFCLFENIAFWEVPRGNHECRSRDATPLVNNKLESMQLQKHCISNAERHCARRSGFFRLVWFENIVFGRFAKCACQPPRGFRVNTDSLHICLVFKATPTIVGEAFIFYL